MSWKFALVCRNALAFYSWSPDDMRHLLQGRPSAVCPQAEASAARPQVQAYTAQLKRSAASCQSMAISDQPRSDSLFRFGIVSDIQYADIEDGHSHKGTPRYGVCDMHAVAGCQISHRYQLFAGTIAQRWMG